MIMNNIYNSGKLELIVGPMRSGKNLQLISRISPLEYTDKKFIIFNPDINTRDNGVKSRTSNWNASTHVINHKYPQEALKLIKNHDIIIFVEAQFFSNMLVEVINKLIKEDKNVIVVGLDLDFKADPFGPIPFLLALADQITKLTAVCTFKEPLIFMNNMHTACGKEANRTQRYMNGVPAFFDSPIILVEDIVEGYEPHCTFHHRVFKNL